MSIKFYTTHCPRCKVIAAKMDKKNIPYEECTDVQEMMSLGMKTAPALSVDGQLMDFKAANDWINAQEG